jgi:peptidoglycan-associated lipoprotein
MKHFRGVAFICVAAVTLVAGCGKKTAAIPTPPAATPQTQAETTPAVADRRVAAPPTTEEKVAPRYPDAATIAKIEELLARIQDAYFDYNKHALRTDAEQTLKDDAQSLAAILKQYPDYKLTVEGHCDERGSDEYNLALGDARARTAKEYLMALGLPGGQLEVVSYGKQRPQCSEHDEACWQKNRRAHIVAVASR